MNFDINEYYNGLLYSPSIFLIIGITIFVIGLRNHYFPNFLKFRLFKFRIFRRENPVNLWQSIAVFCLFIIPFSIQSNIYLLFDNQGDVKTKIGYIEEIKFVRFQSKMYFEGELVHPNYITIEGEKYYIMYIGEFQTSDKVILEYLPKSKIIMSIDYALDESED